MTTPDARPSAAIIPMRPDMVTHSTTPEIFSFGDQPVRVLTIDGAPWFIAKEVCDVLGMGNPTEAIRSLDDDQKNTLRVSEGIRGNPNVNVISESGLYTLALRSHKPEAKVFRKWVTGTVLPAIRKTGSYVRGEEGFDVTTDAGLAAAAMHIMAALQAKADSYKAQYDLAVSVRPDRYPFQRQGSRSSTFVIL